jgi:hypothetical protein
MAAREDATKIVGTVVESLKGQPIALALVVMNVLLLALFYVFLTKIYERRDADMKLLYEQNQKVQQMLFECVPHTPSQH